MNWKWLEVWLLRLAGAVEMLAFGAVVMPSSLMESTHARMGLAEMPKSPVFDAVMREVSFSYGLHGLALWFIAWDVSRYRPLVILTAVGYLVAGPVFFLIDRADDMPWSWIAGNGGSCLLVGVLLSALLIGEKLGAARLKTGASPTAEASSAGGSGHHSRTG